MHNSNIFSLFQSRCPSDRDAVFLAHSRGEVKYSELDVATGKIVTLLKQLGVKKGSRVIVQVDKSPEAVILYLSCLRAGAIFIPLNTAYTEAEVAYTMADAKPRLLVCPPSGLNKLSAQAERLNVPHVLTLDGQGEGSLTTAARGQLPSSFIEACDDDDLACIIYTSGTTGQPKGAGLSHANLSSNAKVLHKYWAWKPGDVLLHALPIFHVHGLFVALHCALLNASKVVFLARFELEAIKSNLAHSTVMMGVPTFYVRLLCDPSFNSSHCHNMRLFISGSAPLLPETFKSFEERTGHKILERYGMTEAGMITSNPYVGERVQGTVGFPLPGVRARIVDKSGDESPSGEVGVLEIKGPNIFQGYWCMPEKTAEEFRDDGYFITGDMATMDAKGRISIVGRAKDLVITGGYNVYPKEVETVIDDHPGIEESAVIGIAHPDFGEAVTAIVVTEDCVTVTEDQVLASLKGKLARFKQPKRVLFIDELPRNAMGKVQKNALRKAFEGLYCA